MGEVKLLSGPLRMEKRRAEQLQCDPHIVKLNVGGVRYMTTQSTLATPGKNALTALVDNLERGLVSSVRDEEGYIFLDRCGVTFAAVLAYLRSGVIVPSTTLTREQILIELDYYSIPVREEAYESPGSRQVRKDRELIRESLVPTIQENTDKFVAAMRLALSDGENCLDIIPAICHSMSPNEIEFRRESGFNKLFGSQVRDELFLDELCAQLEHQVFGCPVTFGVKELRNFTDVLEQRLSLSTLDISSPINARPSRIDD